MECRLFCYFDVPGGGLLISLARWRGWRGAWWGGTVLLGDRSKCTRKRPLRQNAARRQQGGFSWSSRYGRDVPWLFTGPKRPTPGIAHWFQSGSWRQRASLAGVAGGRRWRASLAGVAGGRHWRASLLAGVAGGRRRRSRTKIAVISIKVTETRHTDKPRKQTAHSERRWLARHTTAEHSREDTAD